MIADYLSLNIREDHNRKNYELCLKAWIKRFGSKYAHHVTKKEILEFRKQRNEEDGMAISSCNKELALFKAAYNFSINNNELRENPCKGIEFFNEKHLKRTRYLGQHGAWERELLFKYLTGKPLLDCIVRFDLLTGMRRGEILDLKWSSLDFNNRLIRIEESKSGQKRNIPFHDDIPTILDRLPKECEYVFSFKKERVKEDSLKNSFVRLIDKINEEKPETPIKDFHFHDLRHTFAHDYLAAGGKLGVLKELLGHSSLEMTMIYSSWSEEFKKDSILKMPKLPVYRNLITVQKEVTVEQVKIGEYQSSAVSSVG